MLGCDAVDACDNVIKYDEKKQTLELHEGILALSSKSNQLDINRISYYFSAIGNA